jgi:hypothetical protein
LLRNAFQRLGDLQALVGVRADRDQRGDSGVVNGQQVPQRRQERLGLLLPIGEEQLLALINREDEHRRLGRFCVSGQLVRNGHGRPVRERVEQRPEPCGARIDRRSQFGAGLHKTRVPARAFERGKKACLARDNRAVRPDDRQRKEVSLVAFEARQEACPQER